MGELVVASLLWDANEKSQEFSLAYDESWAWKLFNGFSRNLSVPHRSVLFTDRKRKLPDFIEQIVQPDLGVNGYGDCIRPYSLNAPMILVGLDTLIVRNIDKMARWCLANPGKLALPKHPFNDLSINGVALWGGHDPRLFDDWRGENDMEWVRGFDHVRIESLWPSAVCSWRAHCAGGKVPQGTRIVYFHGRAKFPALHRERVIREHWR